MELIIHPFSQRALGDFLKDLLIGETQGYHTFQAAVAFAKLSGVQHIREALRQFVEHGGFIRLVIGIDQYGTSLEALSALLETIQSQGDIWINHDEAQYVTYHPKMYFFEGDERGFLIVGSGNLTQGGLFSNDEASAAYELDFANEVDREMRSQIIAALDGWCDPQTGTAHLLSVEFLETLVTGGYVKSESELKREIIEERGEREKIEGDVEEKEQKTRLFGHRLGRKRPARQGVQRQEKFDVQADETKVVAVNGFVMTLMQTDVGVGQLTPGTSRRSPEIFIPLIARDAFPIFWKWPDHFVEDPERAGKFDRFGVLMRLGGEIISVNMMTWPVKSDFRLRSGALRSAGQVGDILRIERVDASAGYEYYVEIVPQGTSDYDNYRSLCVNITRSNSKKMWGYYRVAETED